MDRRVFVSSSGVGLVWMALAGRMRSIGVEENHTEAQANIWFVDADGKRPGDGKSWQTACSSIRSALAKVERGDVIWVKRGTYRIDAPVTVADGISLYGGFDGSETTVLQRRHINFANETTILQTTPDVSVMQLDGVRSVHVDGFTLTGAVNASGLYLIRCDKSVTFSNCRVMGNTSSKSGAGLRLVHDSDPLFVNCQFCDNRCTDSGAGLYIDSTSAGMYRYCIVSDNVTEADFGGGMFAETGAGCTPYFFKTDFVANESGRLGSAVYVRGIFEMNDCVITANRVRGKTPGEAVYLYDADTHITFSGDSFIIGNAYDLTSLKEHPGIGGPGRFTTQDDARVNDVISSTTHEQFLEKDVKTVMYEVILPAMTTGPAGAGKRVKQTIPAYQNTNAYHCLYLPENWQPEKTYPVLVDFPGNGPFRNRYGDRSGGLPESNPMGYGLSGGRDFIVLGLGYLLGKDDNYAPTGRWWGDVKITIDYCIKAVRHVCEHYGGDPSAVILTGFSRSAIGTGFIGRHTQEISDLWLGFIAYDGWDTFDYIQSDTYRCNTLSFNYDPTDSNGRGEAIRFERINGRPNFIINSGWSDRAERLNRPFNFPFTVYRGIYRNHNATWALRGTIERDKVRQWINDLLGTRRKPQ